MTIHRFKLLLIFSTAFTLAVLIVIWLQSDVMHPKPIEFSGGGSSTPNVPALRELPPPDSGAVHAMSEYTLCLCIYLDNGTFYLWRPSGALCKFLG